MKWKSNGVWKNLWDYFELNSARFLGSSWGREEEVLVVWRLVATGVSSKLSSTLLLCLFQFLVWGLFSNCLQDCFCRSTLMVHHPAYQGSILMLMKDGLGSMDTDSIKVIILTEEFISHDYISIRCVHLILFWQFFFQISRHADSTWMILAPSPPVCQSCRIDCRTI